MCVGVNVCGCKCVCAWVVVGSLRGGGLAFGSYFSVRGGGVCGVLRRGEVDDGGGDGLVFM